MIDIHFHCLPGIDDGPRDWDEAVALCRAALADGVNTIIATPHVLRDSWLNEDPATRDLLLSELNSRLGGKPEVLPGCEYFFSSDAVELWEMKRSRSPKARRSSKPLPGEARKTPSAKVSGSAIAEGPAGIGPAAPQEQSSMRRESSTRSPKKTGTASPLTGLNSTNHLLVEFPATRIPESAESVFFELSLIGVTPIIAHPERNLVFVERPEKLARLVSLGARAQITAGSLIGLFGRGAQQACSDFFNRGLVHLIASDAHSTNRRPPQLGEARKVVKKIWGTDAETRLFETNPSLLIRDLRVED
jgi:tyrosine-protein phosphatase YwqE